MPVSPVGVDAVDHDVGRAACCRRGSGAGRGRGCRRLGGGRHTPMPATRAMRQLRRWPAWPRLRSRCMTNILLHQGCDWAALPAGSRPSGEPEPPFARGQVLPIMCACGVQLNDCAACRSVCAGRPRREAAGSSASAWCGTRAERHAVPIDWVQVLWPLVLRSSARASSPAEVTAHSNSMAASTQARVEAARLREDCAPARVPPGAARTGWWPPAPHPRLLACRHLLVCGQPGEDVQHGSQPGVRTGLTVRNGAQGLVL